MSTLKFLLESGGLSLDVFGYLEYIDSINNPVALGLFDESFKEDQSGHYTFLFEIAASSIVILLAQEAALISLYGQYQIHTIKRHSDQKSLFEVAFEAKNYSFIAFLMKYCGSDFDFNPQALPQLAFDVLEQEPDLFTHCLNHLSPAGQNQLLHSLITSKPDDKIIVILNQLFSKMSTLAIEQTYSVAIMSGYGARVEPSIPLILDTKVRKRLDRQLDAFRPLSEDEAEYRDRVTIIVALDDLLNLIKKSAPNLKLIQKLLHDRAMVPFKVEDLFRLFHATQGKPAILQMICNHYALPLGIQEYQTCFTLDSSKELPWKLHLIVALLNLACEFSEETESPFKTKTMGAFTNFILKPRERELTLSTSDGVFSVTKCDVLLNVNAVYPSMAFKKTPSGVYVTYSTGGGSVKRFMPLKNTMRDELVQVLADLLRSDLNPLFVHQEHMASRMGAAKLRWSEQSVHAIYQRNPNAQRYESFYKQFILPQIAKYFIGESPINIIDVGCGSGALSNYLLRDYCGQFNYLGYDFNPENISLARSENTISTNIHFEQGDMLQHQLIVANAVARGMIDPKNPTLIILSGSLTRLVLEDGFQALKVLRAIIQTQPNLIIGGGVGEPLLTQSMMRRLGYKVVPVVDTQLNAFAYEPMREEEYRYKKDHKVLERNLLDLSLLPGVMALELLGGLDRLLIQRKQIREEGFISANKQTVIDLSFCEITDKLISKLKQYVHSGARLVCKHNDQSVLDKLRLNFPEQELSLVQDDYCLMHPHGFYQQVHGQQFFKDKTALVEPDCKSNELSNVQR